jgi:serine/threonine protein kinase
MTVQPGQILDGKYKIVRVIGEGGMGAVYEGENVRIRRRVAIKVLHAGIASNTEMVQRFEREAQVAGTVGNDHILEILDLGALEGGERYMVMEYLDGETMTDRIKVRVRLTAREAVQLLRQVLRGLAAAHGAGIVHRDLKPDNIFILREKAGIKDYVKIIDFGISKFSEQNGTSSRMTRTGALMGTPHYMAPEQATGSTEIDRRTDIYAVGIIMYEAVTGRVPFQAETFNQLLFEIALAKITPARQIVPELDPAVDSIIMKASARDPAQRFQTCDEFSAALDAWERTGSAVSVPPEQSLEAIFAASVPRASAPGVGSTDDTIGADTGSRGVSKASVGSAATARSAAPPAASTPPKEPTVNTWASSSQTGTPQKLGASIVAATAVGVLLLAGAGIGAYVFFKSPSPTVPTPSARTAATAPVPPSEPPTAATSVPPPLESAEANAPEVMPTTSASATATAATTTARVTGKPLVPHHKPADKTSKPEPTTKPKTGGINFGY